MPASTNDRELYAIASVGRSAVKGGVACLTVYVGSIRAMHRDLRDPMANVERRQQAFNLANIIPARSRVTVDVD
jgi:hypothetical protein